MKKRVFILLMAMVMMMGFSITVLADGEEGGVIVEEEYDGTLEFEEVDGIYTVKIPVYYGQGEAPYYYEGENAIFFDQGVNAGYSMAETFYLVQTKFKENSGTEYTLDSDKMGGSTYYLPGEGGLKWIKQDDEMVKEFEKKGISFTTVEETFYLEAPDGFLYPLAALVSYNVGEAQTVLGGSGCSQDKYYEITLPSYSTSGTYTYELQQVAGTTLGVTYFENPITLTVVVDGDSVESVTMNAGSYSYYEEEEGETIDVPYECIENTYSTGSLTIEKKVTGATADENDKFEITVEIEVLNGYEWDGTVLVTKGALTDAESDLAQNGKSAAEIITSSAESGVTGDKDDGLNYSKTYTYIFDNITDNSIITLWNLPSGIKYKVYESSTGTGSYIVTYTLSEGEKSLDWQHYVSSGDNHERFWDDSTNVIYNAWTGSVRGIIEWESDPDIIIIGNDSGIENVRTGISLDSLPYILMLIAASAGFVILLSGKRLRNRG